MSATYVPFLSQLAVEFNSPVASLGAFSGAGWSLTRDGEQGADSPTGWSEGSGLLLVNGWVPSGLAGFADQFQWNGSGGAITLANGAVVDSLSSTPMIVV